MKNVIARFYTVSLILSFTICTSIWAQAEVGVSTKPTSETLSKAANAKPPANADSKTKAGGDKLSVNTANSQEDSDSIWIETIDIDGDGTVERAEFLYDDEDKVTYIYSDKNFICTDGNMGNGEMFIVVYNEGNRYGEPAGSGWYAFSLDEGECAAKAAAVWGCEFDANGNATACGLATIDEANDDIIITAGEVEQ